MTPAAEKRLLQCVTSLACIVPLTAGLLGVLSGPEWLRGVDQPVPIDLDSHFAYLSGIFLGVGIGFASCVPSIELRGARFRLLGTLVIAGGLARLYALVIMGPPGTGHIFGLVMELGVVPLLLVWQAGFARRHARTAIPLS